jgi:hypothetical protein
MTFPNIPHTMYYMMVTMTTTGYGDQYPSSPLGKILASFAAVFGILFLAMPLTIVGNSFYNNWNKFLAKQEAAAKRREMLKRRTEYKRKSLMQKDLRRNVEKLVVKASDPGPASKRLDGSQRDILGSYLTLTHVSTMVRKKILYLLGISEKISKNNEALDAAILKADAAKINGSSINGEDEENLYELKIEKETNDEDIRGVLKSCKDLMLDMSVSFLESFIHC